MAGTDGPSRTVDGGAAEVEVEAIGGILEAELIGELSWRGSLPTDDPVETPSEDGLAGRGGCWGRENFIKVLFVGKE